MDVNVQSEKRTAKSSWSSIFRHPLLIMIATIILGGVSAAILVPILTQSRERQAARRELVIVIAQRHSQVKQKLNAIQTSLEMFHKKNRIAPQISDIAGTQAVLRERMEALYLEFDGTAWFWYGEIAERLKMVGLSENDRMQIERALLNDFKNSLQESTKTVDVFWDRCLDKHYAPADPELTVLMDDTRQQLDTQTEERSKIIGRVVDTLLDHHRRR